ncbi:uncharacterized protein LOC121281900 [Carcharodon carcharias]|uniref:uncharacterized protein LOC121281900 n=1 Tax=Carcharodon carcharias TaxID=13397 RepID=UPI001B7DD106|nr:uncharacterized protein LOC121281900 [Carcharodon carcharias]
MLQKFLRMHVPGVGSTCAVQCLEFFRAKTRAQYACMKEKKRKQHENPDHGTQEQGAISRRVLGQGRGNREWSQKSEPERKPREWSQRIRETQGRATGRKESTSRNNWGQEHIKWLQVVKVLQLAGFKYLGLGRSPADLRRQQKVGDIMLKAKVTLWSSSALFRTAEELKFKLASWYWSANSRIRSRETRLKPCEIFEGEN